MSDVGGEYKLEAFLRACPACGFSREMPANMKNKFLFFKIEKLTCLANDLSLENEK